LIDTTNHVPAATFTPPAKTAPTAPVWDADAAVSALASVQQAVERQHLPPNDPTLLRLGALVLAAWQSRDLTTLRRRCGEMIRAAGALPRGNFSWTIPRSAAIAPEGVGLAAPIGEV